MSGADFWRIGYGHDFSQNVERIAASLEKISKSLDVIAKVLTLMAEQTKAEKLYEPKGDPDGD